MKRYSHCHIQPEGELIVFEQTVIIVDGVRCASELIGRPINPGADVSGEIAAVRAHAAAAHTPECIAAFEAQQELARAEEVARVAAERAKTADAKDRAQAQAAVDAAQLDADTKRTALEAARVAYESSRHAVAKPAKR